MSYRASFWTDEEVKILDKEYAFIPPPLLAKKLNRSLSSIYNKINELNLPNKYKPKWQKCLKDFTIDEFKVATNGAKSCCEIYARLGMNSDQKVGRLQYHLRKHNIPVPKYHSPLEDF